MGLLLQGGSANIADVQFEGGAGNKTVVIPKEGGKLAVGTMLSGATAYHLLQGDLSVSNEVITNGFSTTLYTGNGGTQSINTGIDMATQWGDDASEMFGGLSWSKSRSAATNNYFVDTVRGATKDIYSNATTAEITEATGLTSFTSTGFNLGTLAGMNTNLATYVSWNFQTTHRTTGVTNHGKAFTEHYNPFTGFTIIKYEGSGIAGHEIPHSLGRKLAFANFKNLTTVHDWLTYYGVDSMFMAQNLTIAGVADIGVWSNQTDTAFKFDGGGPQFNLASSQHIMYGWANSYYDEADKLIGNYEIGVYQGTGVAGNKVTTRSKPSWVMIKRLDAAENWLIFDIVRGISFGNDPVLIANLSNSENTTIEYGQTLNDGFLLNNTTSGVNVSGGQYLYMVVYDNDSGSGKSKYPRATDNSQLNINNAIIPFAQGIDSNGTKVSTLSKNESITGLTYTQGKNYVYCDKNGAYGVTPYKPRYLESELVRTFASEAPDYYDVAKNKWYSTDNGTPIYTNTGNTVAGWFKSTGGSTTLTTNGSILTTTWDGTYTLYVNYLLTGLTIGRTYTAEVSVSSITSEGHIIIGDASLYGTTNLHDASAYAVGNTITSGASGKSVVKFIANGTSVAIGLRSNGNGGNIKWDNISVFATDIVPTTEITNSRNYLNHIVHADQNGQVTYVEELPKIEYKDIIKANEYRGKNACTAWVNFDGSTTPPRIRDSYNVSSVIRLDNGDYYVYFKVSMDNMNYVSTVDFLRQHTWVNSGAHCLNHSIDKFRVRTIENSTGLNSPLVRIQIIGGKN